MSRSPHALEKKKKNGDCTTPLFAPFPGLEWIAFWPPLAALFDEFSLALWRLCAKLVDLKSLSGMNYETSCKYTVRC